MKCQYCYGELDTAGQCIVCGKYNQPLFSDSHKTASEQILEKRISDEIANISTKSIEAPEDVVELAKAIELAILTDTVYTPAPNGRGGLQVLSKGYTKAAALLVAYGDKIRRECGDRGVEWLHPKGAIYNCSLDDAMKRKERDDSLRAAIEGKE